MRVLVCIKRVPAPGAKIVVTEDGQDVETRHLAFTMSPHEECAVEEAVRLVEAHGGTSTVLTLGSPEAGEQLRYAVSLGIDQAVLISTDGSDWDPMATASAVAAAIRELEASAGPFDLALFGNESADSGGYQVGIRVAHALDRPCVSGVKGIEVEDGEIVARRETEAGFELYRVPTPAVMAVREGINLPRYPTLKGRLAAKKQQVAELTPVHRPGGQQMIRLMSPVAEETPTELLGEGAAAAPRIADLLVELGLL